MKGCRLSGWVLGVWLVGAALGWTQEARHIAQIQFQGLRRVPESTARYYVQSREGDLYDPDMVRQDFRRLWEAGFFEDLRVEAEEGPEGVRLVFRAQEKPIIEQVVWPEKVKGLRIEDIRSKMNEKGLTLYDGDPYDAYRVHQVEQLIRQMLAEKGYRFPEVRPVLTPLSETSVRLTWQIDPGENLRIGQVIFDGNQAFSDDRLRGGPFLSSPRPSGRASPARTSMTRRSWKRVRKPSKTFITTTGTWTSGSESPGSRFTRVAPGGAGPRSVVCGSCSRSMRVPRTASGKSV